MKYKFECLECGIELRDVPVSERDLQVCDCGAVMRRIFEASCNICIPDRFLMDRGNLDAVTPAGKKRQAEAIPYENIGSAIDA